MTISVAANQLVAGAFFAVKMTTRDLTSPVTANQQRFLFMSTWDLTISVAVNQLVANAVFCENDHPGI